MLWCHELSEAEKSIEPTFGGDLRVLCITLIDRQGFSLVGGGINLVSSYRAIDTLIWACRYIDAGSRRTRTSDIYCKPGDKFGKALNR
jgi:hypothetical protein